MSGAAAARASRSRRSGRRWRVAVALAALGLLLQGCAGIAVQLPRSAQLDPVTVAEELRTTRGAGAGAGYARAGSGPRPAHPFERVDTNQRGQRRTYTYTQWPGLCRPLVIGLGPFWPGCAREEVYVIESGRLVAASRKEHVTYGFFCSPLLLFRLHEGVLPCWWEWG